MTKLVDIEMVIHVDVPTAKAVLASDDGDVKKACWLPRSQIEVDPLPNGHHMITMPEWLAIQKELI